MAHWVLALDGEFRAFTLNLGSDIEKQAFAKGAKASRWISQRLNHHLGATLGRPVRYWFRLELSDGESPYLHLHGELASSDAEIPAVREALRKAGGAWSGLRNKQVDTQRKNPDTAWVSYVMKNDVIHLQQLCHTRMGVPHKPSWRDGRFFIAQDLSRGAKALYEDARKKLRIKTKPLRRGA